MGRHLTCITLILSWAWVASADAQQVATSITPTAGPGDLGTKVSKSFDINGGTRPGNGLNLFHSFDQFSLGSGDIANFINDTNLATRNILSRVTGDSRSDIFGTIKTTRFPGADLFLLNPHGIVFGPSAKLDVQGSFHASTADFIRLEDEVRFDAAVPSANDALLTTAPPQAFGFLGRRDPAPIEVKGSVKVRDGKNLSLVGGDIAITGGRLQALGGQVNVASVASEGEVTLRDADLGAGSFARLGKIDMKESEINVSEAAGSATGGGRVRIRGGQLVMDNSQVLADTREGNSKGIDIKLTGALKMKTLEMEKEMEKISGIQTNTKGKGDAGNLKVEARDILLDRSFLFAKNDGKKEKAIGKAGRITVRAGRLRLERGSQISVITDWGPASNDKLGQAGEIDIEAGEVVVEGIYKKGKPSNISAETFGPGDGGDITIRAGHLRLIDGAEIRVSTTGQGDAGNLTIEADEIVLDQTGSPDAKGKPTIFARSGGEAENCGKKCGAGGNITIIADRLHLKDGAAISARTVGPGKGGNLSIRATEVILENGFKHPDPNNPGQKTVAESNLNATAEGKAEDCDKDCGDGGSITIKAERLQLKQGGGINVSTDGSGKSGSIKITADEVVLEGRFDSSVREGGFEAVLSAGTRGKGEGSGNGGNITIKAGHLQLKGHAAIRAITQGDGDAGLIDVKADTVKLVNRGTISSESGLLDPKTGKLVLDPKTGKPVVGKGNAGSVSVDAERIEITEGGSITTTTRGPGRGGKLSITAADLELRDGASITSESISEHPNARSGEIFIQATDSFRLFNDSRVSVKTNRADAGDIDLNVGFLLHLRDSSITTSVAGGDGSGGDIRIDPVFTILDSGSRIVAQAREGFGGRIRIVSDFFFKSPDSEVDASSGNPELSGTVEIDSPDTDLNAALVELPADFFDAATLLTQGCAPGADLSRLVVRKYEVLPDSPAALRVPPPGGLLNADAQGGGFALTRETLGPGFEDSSDCDGDG